MKTILFVIAALCGLSTLNAETNSNLGPTVEFAEVLNAANATHAAFSIESEGAEFGGCFKFGVYIAKKEVFVRQHPGLDASTLGALHDAETPEQNIRAFCSRGRLASGSPSPFAASQSVVSALIEE